ncbi:MAG: LysR family transcriptional regulator substrate-binding protein, partial [Pseudomonadota bacterium]|nr:LysR family transcriptional regulator substrate-binding protein [Pseudomonadota bacterium]
LTRNMKLMEGRLGFEIMVRSRQGIIPTALGARVLEEAGAVVLAERRISALTDNLKRGYETELRVGCTPTLSLHALPQPVADFARDNPSIRLDMRQAHSALLAKMLHDGHVDLVIGPPEIAARVPGTETVPLFSSPVVILASRFHPLAGRKTITNQDLNDARWILHQPGTGIREATDILLRRLGVNETLQASELPSNMILALLRLGDHLAALPRYVLRNMDIASELVQIAGEEPPVLLGHDAITMASQTSKTTGKFISAMRSGLGGLGRL